MSELVILMSVNQFALFIDMPEQQRQFMKLSVETIFPTYPVTTTAKPPPILNTEFLIYGHGLGMCSVTFMLYI